MEASPLRVLLDSAALIALLLDEPAGSQVLDVLQSPSWVGLTSLNLAESLYCVSTETGTTCDDVYLLLDQHLSPRISIIDHDAAQALEGARIRSAHYHRKNSPLSLADCALLAAAKIHQAAVMTSDQAVFDAAEQEQIEVIVLAA